MSVPMEMEISLDLPRLAEYKLLDSNYSDYPPFYAIDIPTVTNNHEPLVLECVDSFGRKNKNEDAHRENPGKNEIIFPQFTKNIIPTTDDAIEKSELINKYYCYFLNVIETAKKQPNFVCEISQNRRTSYCCGFIGCVIAYAMYYAETNPHLNTLNLDDVCKKGLDFYKSIAYTYVDTRSWNICDNFNEFYNIYDADTLNKAIMNSNSRESIILLFTFGVRKESPPNCFIETVHHFVVKVHSAHSIDDNYVTILDAWSGDGERPLWIRIMTLIDFGKLLDNIKINYKSDHFDKNNLQNLNKIIETYFIPPHTTKQEQYAVDKHVACGGFDMRIMLSKIGFINLINGGYNKKTKIKSKKSKKFKKSKKNRKIVYLSSRKRRNN